MIDKIRFGVQVPAPTFDFAAAKLVFMQSWVDAEIFDAEYNYLPPFAGALATNADSWPGIVVKQHESAPGAGDAVLVPAWHTNVVVYGPQLIAAFLNGQPLVNEDGSRRSVWEYTHAAAYFQLTWKDADPETGFPAGYQSASGVVYADAADFTSPANVF